MPNKILSIRWDKEREGDGQRERKMERERWRVEKEIGRVEDSRVAIRDVIR